LYVVKLGCSGGSESFSRAALGLELVLLCGKDVLGYEVLVVELYELFLLGLDLHEGAFVALSFALDHTGSLGQL
jgi:hypothetical protein